MRIGFKLILFMIILNLVSTMVVAIQMPGTTYSGGLYIGTGANATQYETEYNATNMMSNWAAPISPSYGIPLYGDIYGMVIMFFNMVKGVVDGFPTLLTQSINAIPDASARASANQLVWVIRGVYAFIIVAFFVQFISGRKISE